MKKKEKPQSHFSKFQGEDRSYWSGAISFGLIHIPVKLQTAVREKGIRFSLFREKDHCKIRRKYVCETDQKEVPSSEIVKGYEIEEGKHVMLSDEELESLAPKGGKEITLLQFIDLNEIDPLYFSRPYYLLPQKNGKKAYFLFKEALGKSKKAGIGQMVMRSRQYLAALRVYKDVLCLEILHFHDEIKEVPRIEASDGKVTAKEIDTAGKLIESLTEKFHPEKLIDTYRETLVAALQKKKRVRTTVAKPAGKKEEAEIVDLMAALEASLQQTRKKKAA